MLFVAEIGSAHKGDINLAHELIRQAAWAGADVAKFQLGWTDKAQQRWAGNVNDVRFIDDWAEQLREWCDYYSIMFGASVWSSNGVETGKRVDMRFWKLANLFDDMEVISAVYAHASKYADVPVYQSGNNIWCISEYPASYQRVAREMPSFFPFNTDGYSSHTHGIADALLAISRGATYIEKHITLDKSDTSLRDNAFALSPQEFKQMVEVGTELHRLVSAI